MTVIARIRRSQVCSTSAFFLPDAPPFVSLLFLFFSEQITLDLVIKLAIALVIWSLIDCDNDNH